MNKPFTFIFKVVFAALAIPLALMALPSGEAQAALFEYYQTGDGSADAIDSSDTWLAQTFTASANHSVKYVRLYLTRETSLTAGTITVSIKETDVSGNPTGPDLTSASEAVTTVSYTSGWYTIYLPTCALISGTRYAIVVRASNAASGSGIWWSGDPNVQSYTVGEAVVSLNGGSSWQKANNDYLFEVYGDATAATVQTGAPTADSSPPGSSWYSPELAHTNDGGSARGGQNVYQYYNNYNFSIPSGATINGIEIRLDASYYVTGWTSGTGTFRVSLSWNHGTNKTSLFDTASLTDTETTYYVGGPTSTWGKSGGWSPSDFIDANFEVRIVPYSTLSIVTNPNQYLLLDFCPVTVYYTAPPASLPTVTTAVVSGLTSTSAASGGNVTADGGATITARGVCWSTSANPTTADSCTTDGSGSGSFTSSITGLTQATPYHVRAYATNTVGTAYGEELTFTTNAVLSVTIQGDGSGSVSCGGGSCTMEYPYGAAINLMSSPGLRSIFGGWSGDCTGITSTCTVTMDQGRAVIAAFAIDPAYGVWIDPGTNYYNKISDAYQAAGSSAHIKACRLSFSEALLFGGAKTITLTGGYNSAYSDKNALTTVTGSLTVGSGSVIVENLAIR